MGNLTSKEAAICKLNVALNSHNPAAINVAKYEVFKATSNILEWVSDYTFLSKLGVPFDYGVDIIRKGERFYRIRTYDEKVDYSDAKQWEPPPSRPKNRANEQGQCALYLGSTEMVCLLETHIERGAPYMLATYECVDDITLAGFLQMDKNNQLHNLIGMVLNSFLIAPARNDKNAELFSFLDEYYGKLTVDELHIYDDIKLPFKFGVLNQKGNYYKLTNLFCETFEKKSSEGIRYSSCYLPMETIGIECSDYNIVLYEKGISRMKFVGCEKKKNTQSFTSVDIVKALLGKDAKK